MNRFELEKLREASPLFGKLLNKMDAYLNRTFPRVTCRGSQGNEDEILRELLPGDGTYIDIGAAEPVQCSNTWAFYERGWRGLLVEPLFWYWPALLHQRPGDYLYDAAVRNYTGLTSLRVEGTVSSVMPSWNIQEQSTLTVPCETTAEVLAKFPQVRDDCRLCSIDVEGAEKEVIETIDWTTFRPEVFCVEYRGYDPVKLGEDLSASWLGLLEAQGYKEVARTQLSLILQRSPVETEKTTA